MQRDSAHAKISIRENEDIVSLVDGTFGTATHRLERLTQAGFRGVVGRVDHDAAKVILPQPLDLAEDPLVLPGQTLPEGVGGDDVEDGREVGEEV